MYVRMYLSYSCNLVSQMCFISKYSLSYCLHHVTDKITNRRTAIVCENFSRFCFNTFKRKLPRERKFPVLKSISKK